LSNDVPVGSAKVTAFVDGTQKCSGSSSSTGYYTCKYTTTAGSHSWYATATKTGYSSGTSPTWTFTYNPSATTYTATANLKFATTCRTAIETVTLYSGSTQIATNTLTLSCTKTTDLVKFSMLNSGTYTVTITGAGVTTQSHTATVPPNKILSFSI
jgi:hypothetical protein